MQNYVRVRVGVSADEVAENEVRVLGNPRVNAMTYYTQSLALFNGEGEKPAHRSIVIKALGRALNKAVTIAELLKRKIPGLHQIANVETKSSVNRFEPTIAGLDSKEVAFNVNSIRIILSKDKLDETHCGYQAPISESEILTDEKILELFESSTQARVRPPFAVAGQQQGAAPRRRRGGRRRFGGAPQQTTRAATTTTTITPAAKPIKGGAYANKVTGVAANATTATHGLGAYGKLSNTDGPAKQPRGRGRRGGAGRGRVRGEAAPPS